MDPLPLAVVVIGMIVTVIFMLIQVVFLWITFAILIHTIVKFVQLNQQRRKQQSKLSTVEVKNFRNKVLFLLFSLPLPCISICTEITGTVVSQLQSGTTERYIFSMLNTIFSALAVYYSNFLLIYVSIIFLEIIKQMKQSTANRVGVIIAEVTLIITWLVLGLVLFIQVVHSLWYSSINYFIDEVDAETIKTGLALRLTTNTATLVVGYWIAILVLVIAINFYAVLMKHAKKASLQIVIFLGIMIISSVLLNFAGMLLILTIVDRTFGTPYFFVQRLGEMAFMVGLIALYIPLNSIGQFAGNVTKEIAKTVNEQFSKAFDKKKDVGVEEVKEVKSEEIESEEVAEESDQNTMPNTPVIITSHDTISASPVAEAM